MHNKYNVSNYDAVEEDTSIEDDTSLEDSLIYFLPHKEGIKQINIFEPKNEKHGCDHGPMSSVMTFLSETTKSVANIYADQSGSLYNLCQGFSILVLAGIALGLLTPNDENLPNEFYRCMSSIIGYIYFVIWSVAYYPQIITIYIDKSIDGLSTDYIVLTALECICYALYNSFFFWDKDVQQEYQDLNSGSNTPVLVESNDVAYSIHALLVSIAITLQVAYYHGFRICPLSMITIALIMGLVLFSGIYITCILLHFHGFRWLYFLETMGLLKIVFGCASYIPQIILNYTRKSTEGYNMWAIYMDFAGGMLSILQIVLDSIDIGDLREGIMGNWVKLALGLITLCVDSILLIQHYILYKKVPESAKLCSGV